MFIFTSECVAFMSIGGVWGKKALSRFLWTFFFVKSLTSKKKKKKENGLSRAQIVRVPKSCLSRVWTGSEWTSLRNGFFLWPQLLFLVLLGCIDVRQFCIHNVFCWRKWTTRPAEYSKVHSTQRSRRRFAKCTPRFFKDYMEKGKDPHLRSSA